MQQNNEVLDCPQEKEVWQNTFSDWQEGNKFADYILDICWKKRTGCKGEV